MRALLHNGSWVEIDTSCLFNNQYNTTDGKRIFDGDIIRIDGDIRGDYGRCKYCGKIIRRGEEEQHFAERESKSCAGCFYHRDKLLSRDTVSEHTETVVNADGSTTETTVKTIAKTYAKECTYGDGVSNPVANCTNKACRAYGVEWFTSENTFFLAYPDGIPAINISLDELHRRDFVVDDRYSMATYAKKLGSYTLKAELIFDDDGNSFVKYFEIYNCRKHFRFILDGDVFMISDYKFGWKVCKPSKMELPGKVWETVKKLCASE